MKPYVRGKSVFLREVAVGDAEFILSLRTNPEKNKYLSVTSSDVDKQRSFISSYCSSQTDFYFIICDWRWGKLGTVRIYDIREDSFCWGSWILSSDAPKTAAIESALLVYDFAFYSLHYAKSHFDVRKNNGRVVDFHRRFGASVVREDDLNYYFSYEREAFAIARQKYRRFLP
jgi:RimJ/RimL family protein N-acetyltransferase